MIMQCIDNEVKSTEVTQNSAEDEFNNSERPRRLDTGVTGVKRAEKVENCDEVNCQSKYRNDTDYGTVNDAFEYADMKETDFVEVWKEKNPEIVSTDSSISAFKVTSFAKCVKSFFYPFGMEILQIAFVICRFKIICCLYVMMTSLRCKNDIIP